MTDQPANGTERKVVVDIEMPVPDDIEDVPESTIVPAIEGEFRSFIAAECEVNARVVDTGTDHCPNCGAPLVELELSEVKHECRRCTYLEYRSVRTGTDGGQTDE
jgi:ribosomal protein S27AE